MEAFPSYQSQYQNSPYPLERNNDVSTDLKDANDTGFTNVLSPNNRLHHSLSYPPASGRSPRNPEVQVARARSRLQTITSPPAAVRMVSHSPEHQQQQQKQNTLLDSASSLSAFPLPYRPQKTTARYSSPPVEKYSSPTIPLTSQDIRPYYHSSPPGRFLSFDTSRTRTGSLPPSSPQISDSKLDSSGYFSSQNWLQTRDSKWPQLRSQSRRKYLPKGRRYDSPFHQRNRLGGSRHPGHGHLTPPKRHLPTDAYKKRHPGPFYDETIEQISEQLPLPPRLVRCALPSSLPDDQKDASIPDRATVTPGCISQYISLENASASMQPIRESKYWLHMKDDPIFSSNLSYKSELVSIEELVNRRKQILQNRVLLASPPSRQTVMKEQGTQTDIESSTLFPHPERPPTTTVQERRVLTPSKPKHEQILAPPPPPPPPSPRQKQYHHHRQHDGQQFPKENPSSRNRHYRTSSLTDTDDSPRKTHTQQQLTTTSPRVGSLKRSRSDTEDDYYYYHRSDSCHRRRADGVVDAALSPGSFFGQRARTPFYSRRR